MKKQGRVTVRTALITFVLWVVWAMGSAVIWEQTRMDIDVYRDLILISPVTGFLAMYWFIGQVVADRRRRTDDQARRLHRRAGRYLSALSLDVGRSFAARINQCDRRTGGYARSDQGSSAAQALAERILNQGLTASDRESTLNSWNSH